MSDWHASRDKVVALRPTTHPTLGMELDQARARYFVGRQREQALFAALLHADSPGRVLVISGAGGMGKTSLLGEFERELHGTPCLRLDARHLAPTPAAIEEALGATVSRWRELSPGLAVLMIDTVELLSALEAWLRDLFLPSLPAFVRVVLAGRWSPGSQWRSDPAWLDVLVRCEIPNFSRAETRDYLERRAVEPALHDPLYALCRGNPLALALAAGMDLKDPAQLTGLEHNPELAQTLVERLLRVDASTGQQAALRVCALLRNTSQSALAAILQRPDARELFDWLQAQVYVESGLLGLHPHDLVREALTAELKWRDPQQHRQWVLRATDYLLDEMTHRGPAQRADLLMDYFFVLREGRFALAGGDEARGLYTDQVREGDWPMIEQLVAETEGAESLTWLRYWAQRPFHARCVVRDAQQGIKGFLLMLAIDAESRLEAGIDPVLRRFIQFLDDYSPLRDQDRGLSFRFTTVAGTHHDASAAQTLLLALGTDVVLTTPQLAHTG